MSTQGLPAKIVILRIAALDEESLSPRLARDIENLFASAVAQVLRDALGEFCAARGADADGMPSVEGVAAYIEKRYAGLGYTTAFKNAKAAEVCARAFVATVILENLGSISVTDVSDGG